MRGHDQGDTDMKRLAIGFVAGLVIGTPAVAQAGEGWKTWKGLQTGEVIVCKKEKGHPAYEPDRHVSKKGTPYVTVWCNGKNIGRKG